MTSLGIVFPGQGSQTVGMLQDIAAEYKEIQTTFDTASQVLDYDLWRLVAEGPGEELDKTTHTQPALLAASYAIWQILKKQNVTPNLMAGHSLGEYTALVCAGAFDFKDAIKIVAARGQYMQEAVPVGVGALAAIVGFDDDKVEELCRLSVQPGEVLAPANYNSLGQVVIGGHKIAVERALVLAKDQGARLAKLLPVSVPSHCSLMKPAAEKLANLLANASITTPNIPVISNVDVAIYKTPDDIRDGLTRQLYLPVRWVETIKHFAQTGINTIIECGPGKVLSGLNKRIIAELNFANTSDLTLLQTVSALR